MKPEIDEIEVSFFGPGYGESTVVHAGLDDWIVIDSCRDPLTNECIPLRYLDSIGVDTDTRVKLIVATHWHDDHISGLAELYRRCGSAVLACPAAVQDQDFRTFLILQNKFPVDKPGVRELHEMLIERRSTNRVDQRIKFAKAETPLWTRGGELPVTVTALSPTDEGMHRALQMIANLMPDDQKRVLRVRSPDRNDASVVTWVEVGAAPMLFGADLEEEAVHNWTDVLDSPTRPQGAADVFKVPHHGSEDAHHDMVWTEMLVDSVLPVTCPWRRGGRILPSDDDVVRICSFANPMYLTARPQLPGARTRPTLVRKTLKQTGVTPRPAQPAPGHVRLRRLASDPGNWAVELFDGALEVCAG